jgi:hypothetical protein
VYGTYEAATPSLVLFPGDIPFVKTPPDVPNVDVFGATVDVPPV